MTGGWEGGQAEYVRVAFADVNLLKLPEEGPDEKYILLSVCSLPAQLCVSIIMALPCISLSAFFSVSLCPKASATWQRA